MLTWIFAYDVLVLGMVVVIRAPLTIYQFKSVGRCQLAVPQPAHAPTRASTLLLGGEGGDWKNNAVHK